MKDMARNRGFSMIEVLVALLILAIGLLGVASVQSLALKQTGQANVRAIATMDAQALLERLRANASDASDFTKAESGAGQCSGCSAELTAWHDQVTADIPSATTTVTVNGGVAVVTIKWPEQIFGGAPETQRYELRARFR